MNTDLTYASKEDFQTDAQIAAAKQNGEVVKQKNSDNIGYIFSQQCSLWHSEAPVLTF